MALPKRNNLVEVSEGTRKRYFDNLQNQVHQLRNEMERSNFTAVKEICHRLSGSAGLFGLQDLGDACRVMEEAAMAKQAEKMVEAFQVIEIIVNRNVGGVTEASMDTPA